MGNLKCKYCNKTYEVIDALQTHEKQCKERTEAMNRFKAEYPKKAKRLKL